MSMMQTRDAFKQLLTKATSKVADGTNIVIRLQAEDGGWCIAKACSKVGQLNKITEDDQDLYSKAKANLNTSSTVKAVVAWQYEQSADGSFSLQVERCSKQQEDCDCKKQHWSVYKAAWIREPFGFRLSPQPLRMRRSCKKAPRQQQRVLCAI